MAAAGLMVAELAGTAQAMFEKKNYDGCILTLEAILKERPEDDKV
jgi:hypothetical protein